MRAAILSSLCIIVAGSVAIPAHGQIPTCAGAMDELRALERESLRLRQSGATARDEAELRDRYAELNREITTKNQSPAVYARELLGLRAERAEVLGMLNKTIALRKSLRNNEARLEGVKGRLTALDCPGAAAPAARPWSSGPATEARQPGARKPWEREVTYPIPAGERVTPVEPVYVIPKSGPPAESDRATYFAWMTGSFNTGWGRMTLSNGNGTYEHEGGTLTVTQIDGPTVEGVWRQTTPGSCPDGGHWGRFSFTFNPSGFSGNWGHCGGPLDKGGWSGTRR